MKLAPQVFVSHSKPEPDKIDQITERRFWKPTGGLWTSTLDEAGGQWLRWLIGEGYELENEKWGGRLWLLQPRDANIFTIWSPKELHELYKQFPAEQIPRGALGDLRFIDWPAVAENYDGVYTPNPWTWRFGHEDHDAAMFFYSLDAECTCWFNWCFEGEPLEVAAWPYLDKLKSDDEA